MRRFTRHHLTAKCRNGSNHRSNLLNLWWHHHQAIHTLFGNRTLEEIIEVLLRLKKFKDRQGRIKNGDVVSMGDLLSRCVENGYRIPDLESATNQMQSAVHPNRRQRAIA